MNQKSFIPFAIVASCLLFSSLSHAANRLELNLNVGIMNPISGGGVDGSEDPHVTNASVEGAGPGIGAGIFYWFGKHWAFGLEGAYTPDVEIKETYEYVATNPIGIIELEGTSKEPMTHIVTGIKIGKAPEKNQKNGSGYLFLGAGIYVRDSNDSMVFEGQKTVGFSTTKVRVTNALGSYIDSFGFAPGFGFTFPLNPAISLGFDLRLHLLNQDGIRFLNPMLTLSF